MNLPRARLAVAVGCHAVVDFFSFMIPPLLSVIEGDLELTKSQGATLLAIQPLVAGAAQPVAAWLADRFDTRLPGVLGMAMAVVFITLIGHARSYPELLAIYAVGCFGVGAFHPISVACVGQLGATRRGLAISSFFVSGMIGGATGSYLAPHIVSAWGLENLVRLMLPGLMAAMLLAVAIRPVAHRHAGAHDAHASLSAPERQRRWFAVWILFAGAALRSAVHAAITVLIVRWAEQVVLLRENASELTRPLREQASQLAGPAGAALIFGMAMGGFTVGSLLRPRLERPFLILFPIAGALPIILFPRLPEILPPGPGLRAAAFPVAVLMGVAFAGLIPTGVSLAQRTLPHRTSLVSGMMLGGSWAAGAWGPDFAQQISSSAGLRIAFDATAGLLAFSGLLMILLPRAVGRGEAEGA